MHLTSHKEHLNMYDLLLLPIYNLRDQKLLPTLNGLVVPFA